MEKENDKGVSALDGMNRFISWDRRPWDWPIRPAVLSGMREMNSPVRAYGAAEMELDGYMPEAPFFYGKAFFTLNKAGNIGHGKRGLCFNWGSAFKGNTDNYRFTPEEIERFGVPACVLMGWDWLDRVADPMGWFVKDEMKNWAVDNCTPSSMLWILNFPHIIYDDKEAAEIHRKLTRHVIEWNTLCQNYLFEDNTERGFNIKVDYAYRHDCWLEGDNPKLLGYELVRPEKAFAEWLKKGRFTHAMLMESLDAFSRSGKLLSSSFYRKILSFIDDDQELAALAADADLQAVSEAAADLARERLKMKKA